MKKANKEQKTKKPYIKPTMGKHASIAVISGSSDTTCFYASRTMLFTYYH